MTRHQDLQSCSLTLFTNVLHSQLFQVRSIRRGADDEGKNWFNKVNGSTLHVEATSVDIVDPTGDLANLRRRNAGL